MTKRPDDQFTFQGRVWTRSWEDHAYHWTIGNLKVGWSGLEQFDDGEDEDGEVIVKHRRTYYAMCDGHVISTKLYTTKSAMLEASRASMRDAA